MELQEVEYKGFCVGANGRVAYLREGYSIYFSGLTLPRESTSTINAAEQVIEAICHAEHQLNWRQFTFYDLQTGQGYYKYPGEFELSRLTVSEIDGKLYVYSWTPTDFAAEPEHVQEALKHLIV